MRVKSVVGERPGYVQALSTPGQELTIASSAHANYLCARNASNGADIAYMRGRRAVP